MNVSAKTEYACIAMIELAARYEAGQPARLREIVEAQRIPQPFLVQIMSQLKAAGLVVSTRGATGGYRLAKAPDRISLADVFHVVEGAGDQADSNLQKPSPATEALCGVWSQICQARSKILEEVTLANLAARVAEQPDEMFYI
ncbi:Rrf2 family transcriptional regulator [Bremerella cremea]|uniref:Rrf2 family transcriptional regulator n=1 Tax=Blastopirellula marina TaxID=124 RepID=A0A2S8FBE1_9BACT|nr:MULTISPECIES: Rrf2 family transcriptional regulator [Pirellulaceae]PQO29475.1 Rrf2 family transcriptional regulator [Blastopirellula marina]RCS42779.1 Rrf2 family transcriptional regulator [Bremerella cremea]